MADAPEEDSRERLKAALWYAIGQIVDEESLRLNRNATPQFIGMLTMMVMGQIENVAIDLESFAQHAGRTTINTDDVMLLTRRNSDLQGMIKDFIDKQKADKGGGKGKGKAATSKR
ncbi:kinetochore component CENP-S-domain-containing protein [Bombardia bombarda]|uniref:Kinetochore component CENP-S-domain-containing protein n=1 Tax=Bombardia bombarda TaxID=252184 RepID=A0AA39XKI4_9PEZI|nr:kinetochore component CENP-S-domain-containing protein [Bombardia bombarda]